MNHRVTMLLCLIIVIIAVYFLISQPSFRSQEKLELSDYKPLFNDVYEKISKNTKFLESGSLIFKDCENRINSAGNKLTAKIYQKLFCYGRLDLFINVQEKMICNSTVIESAVNATVKKYEKLGRSCKNNKNCMLKILVSLLKERLEILKRNVNDCANTLSRYIGYSDKEKLKKELINYFNWMEKNIEKIKDA